MARRMSWLLVLLLLAAPLALAACDRDNDDDTPVTPDADDHGFDQTVETGFGLTVHYPEGWLAREGDGRLFLAVNDLILNAISTGSPTEYPEGGFGMVLFAPLTPDSYPGLDGFDAPTLISQIEMTLAGEAVGGALDVGEIEEVTVGEHAAARVPLSRSEALAEGYLIGFKPEADVALLAMVLAREGVLDEHYSTALSILAAVEYEIPAPTEDASADAPPPSTPEDDVTAQSGQ